MGFKIAKVDSFQSILYLTISNLVNMAYKALVPVTARRFNQKKVKQPEFVAVRS